MDGWIKLHRKIWDNPTVTKDPDYLAVWLWLLTNASHSPHPALFGKDKITLQPGELITGWEKIASETHVSSSKVGRILKSFKIEGQIEVQTNSRGSLISIVRWLDYQQNEGQIAGKVENNWRASEEQVKTKQECKNVRREEIKDCYIKEQRPREQFDEYVAPQYRARLQEIRESVKEANAKWRLNHE